MNISLICAVFTMFIIVSLLIWIGIIRKELFDPRIYVLYGILHWISISQLFIIFGIISFEPQSEFSEETHIKGSLVILTAILAFLLGYSLLPQKKHFHHKLTVNQHQVNYKKMAIITLVIGIIGHSSLFIYLRSPIYGQIDPLVQLWLPFTGLSIPAAILATYQLFSCFNQLNHYYKIVFGFFIISLLFTSNVTVIFPLFAVFYWYFNRNGPIRKIPRWFVVWLIVISPIIVFGHLFVKEFQNYRGIGKPLSWERLTAPLTLQMAFKRMLALDAFNVQEGYPIILLTIENYVERGRYLYGETLLALLPIPRTIWWNRPRGFGRRLAREVLGEDTTVGWGTPLPAELIANFGYASVPIGYFLLGVVCHYFYRRFLQGGSESYRAFYGIFLPWLFFQQRGDILNANLFPLYTILIILVAFRLAQSPRQSIRHL